MGWKAGYRFTTLRQAHWPTRMMAGSLANSDDRQVFGQFRLRDQRLLPAVREARLHAHIRNELHLLLGLSYGR